MLLRHSSPCHQSQGGRSAEAHLSPPPRALSFADLPIDAESAGLFTQLDGRHPRYFSGLLDVGTVSPDGQAHQVLSHGELLLEGSCQLLTCLEGKGHGGVRGSGTPGTCPSWVPDGMRKPARTTLDPQTTGTCMESSGTFHPTSASQGGMAHEGSAWAGAPKFWTWL